MSERKVPIKQFFWKPSEKEGIVRFDSAYLHVSEKLRRELSQRLIAVYSSQ